MLIGLFFLLVAVPAIPALVGGFTIRRITGERVSVGDDCDPTRALC